VIAADGAQEGLTTAVSRNLKLFELIFIGKNKWFGRAVFVNCQKQPRGVSPMTKYGVKDFLTDLSTGMTSQELIRKYNLSEEKLSRIFGMLRRSDLLALRGLWEQGKLTDSQFMRAFEEVESDLNCDD